MDQIPISENMKRLLREDAKPELSDTITPDKEITYIEGVPVVIE